MLRRKLNSETKCQTEGRLGRHFPTFRLNKESAWLTHPRITPIFIRLTPTPNGLSKSGTTRVSFGTYRLYASSQNSVNRFRQHSSLLTVCLLNHAVATASRWCFPQMIRPPSSGATIHGASLSSVPDGGMPPCAAPILLSAGFASFPVAVFTAHQPLVSAQVPFLPARNDWGESWRGETQ